MTTRRSALVALATTPAWAQALSQSVHEQLHQETGTNSPTPAKPIYFSAADFALLSCLTDLIIPRTDTPGASDAGVPVHIDFLTAHNPKYQEVFRQGFDDLNRQAGSVQKKLFVELANAEQVAILTSMSQSPDSPEGQFFILIKSLTIEGYYTSEPGLVQELGFKGNTFRTSFVGCTHPEHQV